MYRFFFVFLTFENQICIGIGCLGIYQDDSFSLATFSPNNVWRFHVCFIENNKENHQGCIKDQKRTYVYKITSDYCNYEDVKLSKLSIQKHSKAGNNNKKCILVVPSHKVGVNNWKKKLYNLLSLPERVMAH